MKGNATFIILNVRHLHYEPVCIERKKNPKLLGDCLDMVTVVILFMINTFLIALASFTVVYLLSNDHVKLHGHASI